MKKNSLSVVMPALNEEKNIEEAIISTINALHNHDIENEIIVINDGSTDNTAHILKNLEEKYKNIKVIHHKKPKGIGYSVWEGIKASCKDITVYFPADNENDPQDALLYFDLMDRVDIIAPFVYNIEVRGRKRKIISEIYNFIINFTFGAKLNYHNGTTFYRRVIFDNIELSNFGFFFQTELLIKLIKKGYLFAEVPNYLKQRVGGKSKAISFKSFIQVTKGYLNLVYTIHIKSFIKRRAYGKLHPESITYKRNTLFKNEVPRCKHTGYQNKMSC